jgi:hypothetical protein
MRPSLVKVGAMCAATLLSSIAYAQQTTPSSPTPQGTTKPACPSQGTLTVVCQTPKTTTTTPAKPATTTTTMTWTLFQVTVPYNGSWTISAVAAFNTKGEAYSDCMNSIGALLNGIPRLAQATSYASKHEGSPQYLICLPGSAPSGGRGGGGSEGGGGGY